MYVTVANYFCNKVIVISNELLVKSNCPISGYGKHISNTRTEDKSVYTFVNLI